MCTCQRTSSRNWFPPSTMWVLGSSLGHEVGCNAFPSTEPPAGSGSCYSLSSPPQTFVLQTLPTPHSKSEIWLPLLTVTPRSQLAPVLFSLHCGQFSPSDSSSALFPKFHVIWQPDCFPVVLWKVSRYLQRACLLFKGKDTERGFRRHTPS